jgi:hypothetical protein
MKKLSAILAFISVLFSANAHEYYFAFGEVEYNESTKKLEVTLELSAHDLEFDMRKSGIMFEKHLEDQTHNPDFKDQLKEHLSKGFNISIKESNIPLKLVGYDIFATGLIAVFFESEPIEIFQAISFKFDLLMDSFPNQQNKITFIANTKKQTAVFLPSKRTEIITL